MASRVSRAVADIAAEQARVPGLVVHGLDSSIVPDDSGTGLVAGRAIPLGRGLTRHA